MDRIGLLVTRRGIAVSLATLPLFGCALTRSDGSSDTSARAVDRLLAIEARSRGRVGIAALDLGSGRMIGHRMAERFAMCSTFKLLLAGLILQRVDRGEERLDRCIRYGKSDLVAYSPVTEKAAGAGLTVAELCAATVSLSDNTAANILIAVLGGPTGFTTAIRALGDPITRLDRIEPELNENAPGDPRDTSTPAAMVATMRTLLFGDILTPASRDRLQGWMIAATTGLDRLRVGLPGDWTIGDKTGTSDRNQNNDAAFALPPAGSTRRPVLIVSFLNIPDPIGKIANALHTDVARVITDEFGLDVEEDRRWPPPAGVPRR